MQVEVWKISSSSGFHFGRHGLGQEETLATMPSDSLFAALVNRLAVRADGDVETFITPFRQYDPPFALSSTYLFAGDVLFFPVPLAVVGRTAMDDDAKKYKRIKYVSEALFRKLLSGVSLQKIHQSAHTLMGETVLVDASEQDKLPADIRDGGSAIWAMETRPRVTLGRAAQNSNIYFTGRVTYAAECGLWFGVYWRKSTDTDKALLQDLLTELGDSGLGAERSVGFGACEIKLSGSIDLPDAEGKPWVSLSRYLPRESEVEALKQGAYKIVSVSGWLDSPVLRGQRRRPVNMLEEGATLGNALSAVPGDIVDVSPHYNEVNPLGHEVYRSGMALAVAWNGGLS